MVLNVYNSLNSLRPAKKWFEFCPGGITKIKSGRRFSATFSFCVIRSFDVVLFRLHFIEAS